MIVWFDKTNGRVIAYNGELSKKDEKEHSEKSPDNTIIVEGLPDKPHEFTHPVLYVDLENNMLKWVDEHIETKEEPTQLDRIEENVNKLVTETTVTDVLLGVE